MCSRTTLHEVRRFLSEEFARGRLHLFTGAGFSSDASDPTGRAIPTGPELADELWELCFDGELRDPDSSLEDLFHVALARRRDALGSLLGKRLSVDPARLPDWYEVWFALPWRRAYTINVDDIEVAATRRFDLPRRVRSISALVPGASCAEPPPSDELEFVHLNGMLASGPEGVTFSPTQYGARLARTDVCYQRLAEDLERHPFVFVGTKLAESPLWQHLDGRAVKDRPRSLLVAPGLSRARQALLQSLNIEWVRHSAADFARSVLAGIRG